MSLGDMDAEVTSIYIRKETNSNCNMDVLRKRGVWQMPLAPLHRPCRAYDEEWLEPPSCQDTRRKESQAGRRGQERGTCLPPSLSQHLHSHSLQPQLNQGRTGTAAPPMSRVARGMASGSFFPVTAPCLVSSGVPHWPRSSRCGK